MLFKQVSHDGVVAEGVDAYVAADAEAVVEYGGEGAVSFGQTRNAVDYIVRLVVEPSAVVDFRVGRVGAWFQGERSYRFAFRHEDVAGVGCDVIHDDVFAGIAVFPLSGVAAVVHYLDGRLHELHDGGKVGFGGGAYCELWFCCHIVCVIIDEGLFFCHFSLIMSFHRVVGQGLLCSCLMASANLRLWGYCCDESSTVSVPSILLILSTAASSCIMRPWRRASKVKRSGCMAVSGTTPMSNTPARL